MTPDECTTDRAILGGIEGWVFDVQRYSLHDGPGLRTNVFFKGCPLRCRWCSNPESQTGKPELAFFQSRCFNCGDCLPVCPTGALKIGSGKPLWDRTVCDNCGRCVEACPSGAVRWIGCRISVSEVLEQALRDTPFYQGEGGITLTGGEPMLQPAFAKAILRLAQTECIHTTMETCGHVPWRVLQQVLPYLDLVLYDIKHMDPDHHREGTGVGNRLVLDNARKLVESGAKVIIRFPLIPEFNMGRENIRHTARFVRELGVGEVHLLPYHRLGRAKYQSLDRCYLVEDLDLPTNEQVESVAGLLDTYGLRVRVGG